MAPDRHLQRTRISDAERANAVDRLFAARHAGRISLDEFDERLSMVYAAVTTDGLDAPLADLPRPEPPAAADVLELDAGSAGLTRSGRWSVPRRVRVQQHVDARGMIYFDFTTADLAHPGVDVELRLGAYGWAQLVLPRSASADLSALRGPGRLARTEVPTEPTPAGTHFRVHGLVPRRREVTVGYAGARRWWLP